MTYFLTALTADHPRLIAKEARTTCTETADLIAVTWEAAGYIVIRRSEG